jgi:serine O-acetyltransferase
MALGFFKRIAEDVDATMARDPAARSRLMVILTYPCFYAVLFHRLAHRIYKAGFYTPARMVSQFSRFTTGIEINPGARIGRRLFIDHGMGVVIGETAIVGDDVTLYHDVTLGGISPSINSASQVNVKRHPTLEDGVIVGAGAQILGDIVVGRNAAAWSSRRMPAPTSMPMAFPAASCPTRSRARSTACSIIFPGCRRGSPRSKPKSMACTPMEMAHPHSRTERTIRGPWPSATIRREVLCKENLP